MRQTGCQLLDAGLSRCYLRVRLFVTTETRRHGEIPKKSHTPKRSWKSPCLRDSVVMSSTLSASKQTSAERVKLFNLGAIEGVPPRSILLFIGRQQARDDGFKRGRITFFFSEHLFLRDKLCISPCHRVSPIPIGVRSPTLSASKQTSAERVKLFNVGAIEGMKVSKEGSHSYR